MPTPVVICDDSSFARNQLARSLPRGWNVDLTFAANGHEALAAVREGKGHVLFLDLTMPDMDGFQVLERIRAEDLPTLTIVVSGDVQPESRLRALRLGALAFVRKPVNAEALLPLLEQFGLLSVLAGDDRPAPAPPVEFRDWCQELANVAMGRAADLLARAFRTHAHLSVPRVSLCTWAEVRMLLDGCSGEGMSVVTQGFVGAGLGGETLLLFEQGNLGKLASLTGSAAASAREEAEAVLDVSNVLVGAFLRGLADQLDIHFSQSHPAVHLHNGLGAARRLADQAPPQSALAIELRYTIGPEALQCEQLILFTERSIKVLRARMSVLTEAAP